MDEIIIKYADSDTYKELVSVGFDRAYIETAKNKYKGNAYKIFNLKPYEANILKQSCLSLGFDCAVHRGTVMCRCEYTNAVIFASKAQVLKLIENLKLQPFNLKNLAFELDRIINNNLDKLYIKNHVLDWSRTYIAGILNVTPDSFSDGGCYNTLDLAVSQAEKLIQDGADIIDIGGESTNPNSAQVDIDEEINRVIPVIKQLRANGFDNIISVDTRNYKTAKTAIEAGANIINDVSGFEYDKDLFNFVCHNNIPCIVMHSDTVPAHSVDFTSDDIVEQVYISLNEKINKMLDSGIQRESIIADVGIGFGKSPESCYTLLKRHNEFSSLGVPMMLGISRKSFINKELEMNNEEKDTITALYSAMAKGVNIHRVHNVALTKKYLDFAQKIQ